MGQISTVDSFSRYMAGMFDIKDFIYANTGFQAFFGNPAAGAETVFSPNSDLVDIDVMQGNKRIAALIPRDSITEFLGPKQRNTTGEVYETQTRRYPLAKEESSITGSEIARRVAGENPYDQKTRMQRLRMKAARLHGENMRRLVDLHEVLAAQSVLEGKQDAILNTTNTDLQYDFRRSAGNTITVTNQWTAANADILGDLDDACLRAERFGRMTPDFLGLHGAAMEAFVNDANTAAVADNRRFQWIMVSNDNPVPDRFMRFVNNGWTPRGRIVTPRGYELWVFTYNKGYYDDDAGAKVEILPVGTGLVTNCEVRADRYFGPPVTLPQIPMRDQFYREMLGMDPAAMGEIRVEEPGMVVDPRMFYTDAYANSQWTNVKIRTWSAPIFATTHTDAFVVLKNLTA